MFQLVNCGGCGGGVRFFIGVFAQDDIEGFVLFMANFLRKFHDKLENVVAANARGGVEKAQIGNFFRASGRNDPAARRNGERGAVEVVKCQV